MKRSREAGQSGSSLCSGSPMPGYVRLSEKELERKIEQSRNLLKYCPLCPNECRANRLEGNIGLCGQANFPRVARAIPHFGEENPLSGASGAGTLFFSGCTMRCLFCQNYQISREQGGETLTIEELASAFLKLQRQGCHNIELVSPTPHIPFILEALYHARNQGLNLPIVYNSNGFLSRESLDILSCIVDIYLPDMKYSNDEAAWRLSKTREYVSHNRAAVREMFRQCGPLVCDGSGIAWKGVIIRILLLPGNYDGAEETLEFVAKEISKDVTLSIMSQYTPLYRAEEIPQLAGKIDFSRVGKLVEMAENLGFCDIWVQDEGCDRLFIPDFKRNNPFGKSATPPVSGRRVKPAGPGRGLGG